MLADAKHEFSDAQQSKYSNEAMNNEKIQLTNGQLNSTHSLTSPSCNSPPSSSPKTTTDAINNQQESPASKPNTSTQQQAIVNSIATNGFLQGIDFSNVSQLYSAPFADSLFTGMSHINGHLQNVSLQGPSGIHLSATGLPNFFPGNLQSGIISQTPAALPTKQMRSHECPDCARGGLQQHSRIHVSDRPYHCHFCPKRFTQKSHLDQHERIHTGQKPFSCQYCGRAFRQRSQQIGHEQTHTNGNGVGNVMSGVALAQHLRQDSHRDSISSDQSCQSSPMTMVNNNNDSVNTNQSQLVQAQQQQQQFLQAQQQQAQQMANAAMLSAMLYGQPGAAGNTQLTADSLLALNKGTEHIQQTIDMISSR